MTGVRVAFAVVALVVGVGGIVTGSWAVAGAMLLVLISNLWPVWRERRSRRTAVEPAAPDPPTT
jgi:hypothetical protein